MYIFMFIWYLFMAGVVLLILGSTGPEELGDEFLGVVGTVFLLWFVCLFKIAAPRMLDVPAEVFNSPEFTRKRHLMALHVVIDLLCLALFIWWLQ